MQSVETPAKQPGAEQWCAACAEVNVSRPANVAVLGSIRGLVPYCIPCLFAEVLDVTTQKADLWGPLINERFAMQYGEGNAELTMSSLYAEGFE